MEVSKDSVTGKSRIPVVVAAAVAAVEGVAGMAVAVAAAAAAKIMEETGGTGTATAIVLTKMNSAGPRVAVVVGTSTTGAAIGPMDPVPMELALAMVHHPPRMANLHRLLQR